MCRFESGGLKRRTPDERSGGEGREEGLDGSILLPPGAYEEKPPKGLSIKESEQ
jgi:hypothetical protein